MTPPRNPADTALIKDLERIAGRRFVRTAEGAKRRYVAGYRIGSGMALAVVFPGTLVEQWQVLQLCVAARVTVIVQAANTGLTGGSTPWGRSEGRVIVVNVMRLTGLHLIDQGKQVVCLPGATLHALECALRPLGREPHSVIGSSCIGASVIGGICNNSGGALVRRGPAYTELALYAQVGADGTLQLVNHLGICLGEDPETILDRIEKGKFDPGDVDCDTGRQASDRHYQTRVREIDAATPARYNANPAYLYEASGCAGKVMVFAVRLDTFEREDQEVVFYIGSNAPADFTRIRRDILRDFTALPVSGEYIHRDAFTMAETYGKDTFLAIKKYGTDRLPRLFAAKSRFDALAAKIPFVPAHLSDRLMQFASGFFPSHLPPRMIEWRDRYEHHLLLKMSGPGIAEARTYLALHFPSPSCGYFECNAKEAADAFLHRFAVAGAAVRYRAIHQGEVGEIVALDIALRRNDEDWFETLPDDVAAPILHKLYYGHFFCHVFHQDYIVRKGTDPMALEHRMWDLLDQRGAEYPAEHNVGHLYSAKPPLAQHYARLDPCNMFNPGIGQASRQGGLNDGPCCTASQS